MLKSKSFWQQQHTSHLMKRMTDGPTNVVFTSHGLHLRGKVKVGSSWLHCASSLSLFLSFALSLSLCLFLSLSWSSKCSKTEPGSKNGSCNIWSTLEWDECNKVPFSWNSTLPATARATPFRKKKQHFHPTSNFVNEKWGINKGISLQLLLLLFFIISVSSLHFSAGKKSAILLSRSHFSFNSPQMWGANKRMI